MKTKEKKPMSLPKKILSVIFKSLLVLLALIIVAVGVFAAMFWDTFVTIVKNPAIIPYVINNFGTFTKGLNMSSEEIEIAVKDTEKAQAEAFSGANINLTESDISALSDSNLTEEERVALIYNAMMGTSATEENTDNKTDATDHNREVSENPQGSQNGEETSAVDGVVGDSDNESKPVTDNGNETTTDKTDKTNKTDDVTDKSPHNNVGVKPDEKTDGKTDTKVDVKPDSTGKADNSNNQSGQTAGNANNSGSQPGGVKPPVVNPPAVKPPVTNTTGVMSEEQYNQRVAELVAKMYSIKADFLGQLSAFESRIKAEYSALPKEQQTTATKARIVSENMSYIMGLEAQCDAQVSAVTSELTTIMVANGKPTTLVDQINAAYISEKEAKKAYYVSMYK